MNLGERIAAWRLYRGLTQGDLAEACGVTVSAVSLWESGKTAPRQEHLLTIVKLFGITMERFYGRVPTPKAKAS